VDDFNQDLDDFEEFNGLIYADVELVTNSMQEPVFSCSSEPRKKRGRPKKTQTSVISA
jgi:hypothetical protein